MIWKKQPIENQIAALNSNINTEWFQRLRLGYLMESRVEARDQPSTINNFFNGLTYVSSTSQGAPADYCLVLAFSVATYAVQFAVQAYSTNIWLRSGSTDGNNWSAWKQMTVS